MYRCKQCKRGDFCCCFLCYQSPLSFACRDPLLGRYMTLQKYNHYPDGDHNYINLIEVDIEVYCSPVKEAEAACHTDQSKDMCDYRDLITESNSPIFICLIVFFLTNCLNYCTV